jgi:hypothetical protein
MEENNTHKVICQGCNREKSITSFTVYGRNGYRRKVCKICVSSGITTIPKDIIEDNPELKYCPACNVLKSLKQFYRNKVMNDGYQARCKMCQINNIKINKVGAKYPNRKPHEQKWENYFNIIGVTKSDYRNMFLFLESSGYSLDEDIHEQFCIKWGLPSHNPKQVFKNQYTPKDFNLSS